MVYVICRWQVKVYQNEIKNKIEITKKLGHFKVWED